MEGHRNDLSDPFSDEEGLCLLDRFPEKVVSRKGDGLSCKELRLRRAREHFQALSHRLLFFDSNRTGECHNMPIWIGDLAGYIAPVSYDQGR